MLDIPRRPLVGKIDSTLSSVRTAQISTIAWRRKRMLAWRHTLEEQWSRLFPKHNLATLRLIRPSWDEKTLDLWRKSARAYHADRQKWGR
jgi:hypothetical protein